jgi:hypothetical protein
MSQRSSFPKLNTPSKSKLRRRSHKAQENTTTPNMPITQVMERVQSDTYSETDVMQLQRTIGNRATQQLIQRQPKPQPQIQRLTHDDGDWGSVTKSSMATSVNPVFFLSNDNGQSVVVKALNDSPARAMFAQGIMEDVAGLKTAKTRIINPKSPEATERLFPQIAAVLRPMRQQYEQVAENLKNTNDEQQKQILVDQERSLRQPLERMERGLIDLGSAQALMVMETLTVASFSEFGEEKANKKLGADKDPAYYEKLFTKASLWQSMGRIFAVDQFLGNEDRLETFKIQNLFVNPEGELIALDNDAIMQDYVRDYTITEGNKKKQKNLSGGKYVEGVIGGGFMYAFSHDRSELLQERPSANVELIAGDIEEKITGKFMEIVGRFSTDRLLKTVFTGEAFTQVQDTMKTAMVTGARETRDKLLKLLNDGSLKQRYDQTVNQYQGMQGNDKMFNFGALEMRGKYLNMRDGGGKSEQEALQEITDEVVNTGIAPLETMTNTLLTTVPDFVSKYVNVDDYNQRLEADKSQSFDIIKEKNIKKQDTARAIQMYLSRAQRNRVELLRETMIAMANEYKKKDFDKTANDFNQLNIMASALYNAIPARGVFGEKTKQKRRGQVTLLRNAIQTMRDAMQNM